MSYKAVIFDLDGTLINTLEDLTDAMNFALGELGQPMHPVDGCMQMIGNGVSMFAQRALSAENQQLKPELIEILRKRYEKHCFDRTMPYPQIEELLETLKSRGIFLAVCTNKDQGPAEMTVRHFFGEGTFQIIAGADNGVAIKPDPGAALGIVDKLCLKPENCLFVGDSDVDILTAINARIEPVGV
ncbi:MAG: HAD-IA family hydrolase, partial [Anaerohalosphaera sp.]|nr:HAD-IA family hydrolase [Anaerohalosphaera sp.]